jgi:HlyD family secretion protein
MKQGTWIVIIAVIAVALFFGRSMFMGETSATNQPSAMYERVVTVERGDLEVLVSANGVVEPINRVEIKSKASGQIEEMSVEEGDELTRNGLIARLDRSVARNDLAQARADLMVAEANLTQAENNLRRSAELFERGLISAEEMDRVRVEEVRAQSQLVRAKAAFALAEERMEETIVRSPIDGIVLTKDVEVGQIISSGVTTVGGGTLIATIADMQFVHVKAQVDEVDIGMVKPGQKARIVADAYPNRLFTGEVIRVAPQGRTDQNITTFRVTILVRNEGGFLKAGMSSDIEIEIASKQNIVLVPNEALVDPSTVMPGERAGTAATGARAERGGPPVTQVRAESTEGSDTQRNNRKVVLVKKGTDIEPRRIVTGINNFDYTEVIEGLSEGEEIVIRTLSRARQFGIERQERMRGRSGFSGFGR